MEPNMTRGTLRLVSIVALTVAGVLAASSIHPGAPAAGAAEPQAGAATVGTVDVLVLNFKGMAQREQTPEAQRFQWSTDLYSMGTGQKIGTGTDNFEFITPFSGDHVMTFRLPDGQLVAHSTVSIAPSVLHAGFFHVGVHPSENNIVSEKGTGAYAGRTGKVQMSGWHDCRNSCPEQATFNDFYLIELDPKFQ